MEPSEETEKKLTEWNNLFRSREDVPPTNAVITYISSAPDSSTPAFVPTLDDYINRGIQIQNEYYEGLIGNLSKETQRLRDQYQKLLLAYIANFRYASILLHNSNCRTPSLTECNNSICKRATAIINVLYSLLSETNKDIDIDNQGAGDSGIAPSDSEPRSGLRDGGTGCDIKPLRGRRPLDIS